MRSVGHTTASAPRISSGRRDRDLLSTVVVDQGDAQTLGEAGGTGPAGRRGHPSWRAHNALSGPWAATGTVIAPGRAVDG